MSFKDQRNSKLEFLIAKPRVLEKHKLEEIWDSSSETETTELDSTSRGTEQVVVASQPSDPEMAAMR